MTVRQKSMFEAEMTMTIKNIRREDLGSYICVAKNSLGDVESKIRLYGKNDHLSTEEERMERVWGHLSSVIIIGFIILINNFTKSL